MSSSLAIITKNSRNISSKIERDRFIPSRLAMQENQSSQRFSISSKTPYEKVLAATLLPSTIDKILIFNSAIRKPSSPASANKSGALRLRLQTTISISDLQDDFYTNNLSWGAKDVIAIGSKRQIWLKSDSPRGQQIPISCDESDDCSIKCVTWAPDGKKLYWGTTTSCLIGYDCQNGRVNGPSDLDGSQVKSLDFRSNNECTVATNKTIFHLDLRQKKTAWKIDASSEVCRVQWSPDSRYLAIGEDDNVVQIFDVSKSSQRAHTYSHGGSVKALQWNPRHRFLLASGGGSDRQIICYDGKECVITETGSQVCDLTWMSKDVLVSAHGYLASNSIKTWKYNDQNPLAYQEGFNSKKTNFRMLSISKDPNSLRFVANGTDQNIYQFDLSRKSKVSPPQLLSKDFLKEPHIR